MYSCQFTKIYKDIQKDSIWKAWSNVNHWPQWDKELQYCQLEGNFEKGKSFILKPKQGPRVKIILSEVIPNEKFTTYCKFLGANMYNMHELTEEVTGLRITNTISLTGPLAFLWKHLVVKKVVEAVPIQTDNLVQFARINDV